MKICTTCGAPLRRREDENPSRYERRSTCGGPCAKVQRWKFTNSVVERKGAPAAQR